MTHGLIKNKAHVAHSSSKDSFLFPSLLDERHSLQGEKSPVVMALAQFLPE